MKLFRVRGVVIKEIPYKENDKIITLMTDTLGKISCMAKGAKKTNSPLLAPCQFLVCSEFVLYKGTSFYHINSAEIVDTFYKLRTDYDKLEIAYHITKILNTLTYENQESDGTLSLFLNTIYLIENTDKLASYIKSVFKLKLLALLGYSPNIVRCESCNIKMIEKDNNQKNFYYSFITNTAICNQCYDNIMQKSKNGGIPKTYNKILEATFYAISYVISSDIKKVYSFEIKPDALKEFEIFVDKIYNEQIR